jgi:hypothetical protein
MEITAQVEEISELKKRKFTPQGGREIDIEWVELVLNNGIDRIACETVGNSLARTICSEDLKERIVKGDTVRAQLVTDCSERSTSTGEKFWANRTKCFLLKKIPDFREAPVF